MDAPPKLKKVWKSIDAWRGYYTNEIDPKDVPRTKVIDLSYVSRDPEENEKFLKLAKDMLKKSGFNVRKSILQGSNVFAMNVALVVFKDRQFTPEEKDFLTEFEDVYIDYYTRSFSIFSGKTYPIDFKGFEEAVKGIAKNKLKEVV